MNKNVSDEKERKNDISEISTKNVFLDFFFFQKVKQWWASTFAKLIAGLVIIVLLFEFIIGFCDVSKIFGWNWCKVSTPPPPPETIIELAHRLFGNNNSADLRVRISPSILNIGENMYMYFNTNGDGYLFVLNINRDGALSQLIPRVSQEKTSYLKLKKGQERIIPDPDDPYDLPRFLIEKPVGKENLVAILVKSDDLPLGIVSVLGFANNMQTEPAKKLLKNLHSELEKSVLYEWSSLVVKYETFSFKKGD